LIVATPSADIALPFASLSDVEMVVDNPLSCERSVQGNPALELSSSNFLHSGAKVGTLSVITAPHILQTTSPATLSIIMEVEAHTGQMLIEPRTSEGLTSDAKSATTLSRRFYIHYLSFFTIVYTTALLDIIPHFIMQTRRRDNPFFVTIYVATAAIMDYII
jgi:hypothetical protein